MIPILYNNLFTVNYRALNEALECIVIEERNGMFEAELKYSVNSPNWDKLVRGSIIIADANDTLKNQKFRIYKVSKTINNTFKVYAKHISYDLLRDYIESINIENQSCEYALNTIFRSSQFSQKFKGYSDIIAAQNFKANNVNPLNAIAGVKGSIIDTYGTGAEILRDNENIHVLNKRGHDNGVTIEYAKNLTGLDMIENDDSELITRIKAIAKISDDNGERIIESNPKYIDSPRINDYETPYVKEIDFSDKFEEWQIPTPDKLKTLAEKYYEETKCDIPKSSLKINFIPLSKCVGYEGLEDKISICDIVTIKDKRYSIETKAKVIKATYNTLKERYESMEIGEPRTSLGSVLGGNSASQKGEKGEKGDKGDKGDPGADGNIGDFPDSLPTTPRLSYKLYGFSNIELSWTFESKVYYQYELYASKTKNFIPNEFDIIHRGQSSSFLFQAKANETWYFKVCAINSHGRRSAFSSQVTVTTTKINDLSNYVSNMAIGDALIGTLNLDRGWYGELRGNYIDAKQLSVTDGNGKRTLDIDSYGNVNLDVNTLKINSEDVSTKKEVNEKIDENGNKSGNMISNSNVLVDLEGFEAIGGSISRYEYIPPVEIVEEEETSLAESMPNTSTTVTTTPPTTGEDMKEIEVIKPPITSQPIVNNTQIHFLHTVDTGDCILITCDNGEVILIDSVDNRLINSTAHNCTNDIISYIKSLGITKIDYIINTHFHSDHAGGLDEIMDNFNVKNGTFIYKNFTNSSMPSVETTWKTNTFKTNVLNAASRNGMNRVTPSEKQKFIIDDNTYFEIYNATHINYSDYNSSSLVIYFVHGNNKFLFLGDLNTTRQSTLYSTLPANVDVVKDSHHGYNTTIDTNLIKRCNPKDVVVTRNKWTNFSYNRAYNSIGMWQSYEKNIYTLFKTGTHLIITSNGNDYTFNTNEKFYFENCWLKFNNDNNKWCYFKTGGSYAKNETIVLEGKKYNFDSNGFCTNPFTAS